MTLPPPPERAPETESQTEIEQAMAAAQRGELPAAAELFERAARGFLAAGKRGHAMAALSNLAFMRKGLGQLAEALAAIDEGLALVPAEASEQERAPLLLTRAGVLDRLGDPRAIAAWDDTAQAMRHQRILQVVCKAHAAGARMPVQPEVARRLALEAIRELGGEAPLPFLVGVIGAVGDSAPGEAGIPYLAQATLLMFAHPETCTASNAPFLEMLAQRVGYASAMAETVCLIGLLLSNVIKGSPEQPAVMSNVARVLHGAGAARGLSMEQMADKCQAEWTKDVGALVAVVEQLVGEHWLVRGSVELS